MLLHKIAYNDCGTAADPCKAVDQDAAPSRKSSIYESMAGCEMLFQVGCGGVELCYPLIGVLFRKFRVEAGADGQNMCNAIS